MEFVVLQNLFMTKTAQHAHVILPVAAYGEEDVTFTSTERRIQRAVQAIDPALKLSSAWRHVAEVANRMGARWPYASSDDVLAEIGSVVPEYGAVSAAALARDYGLQWPCTHDRPLGTPMLFTEKNEQPAFHFVSLRPASPESALDTKEFPFVLSFRHSLYYWHQNTLVRHSETLKREYGILLLDYPEGFVEINDQDAADVKLRDGQRIKLVAAGGEAYTFARVTPEVRRGIVSVPFFLQDVMRSIGWKGSEKRSAGVAVRIEKAG
jgi:formate dehydrogenase major subunit